MPDTAERPVPHDGAIRGFETSSERLLKRGELTGNVHLSIGQEAVAAGVCGVLRRDDHITTTHRGHGHCIAKGGAPERMYAELLGRTPATAAARRARCTSPIPATGNLGPTAIVGGGIAMAAGAALCAGARDRTGSRSRSSARARSRGQLPRGAEPRRAVGAAARARVREQRLRRADARACTSRRRCRSGASAARHPGRAVDGNDVRPCAGRRRRRCTGARGRRPDAAGVRRPTAGAATTSATPSATARGGGRARGASAIRFRDSRRRSARPRRGDRRRGGARDRQARRVRARRPVAGPDAPAVDHYPEALTAELAVETARSSTARRSARPAPRRWSATRGRPVRRGRRAGGRHVRRTRGLLDRFGPVRVRDTPISEGALVGAAIGAAMTGLRPIVEIMFLDFLMLGDRPARQPRREGPVLHRAVAPLDDPHDVRRRRARTAPSTGRSWRPGSRRARAQGRDALHAADAKGCSRRRSATTTRSSSSRRWGFSAGCDVHQGGVLQIGWANVQAHRT